MDPNTAQQINSQKRAMARTPMTKEQYEKEQSVVRRVFDEESGRYRLIRGSGEVIEEIVSKRAHEQINKAATLGDGASFARHISRAASASRRT